MPSPARLKPLDESNQVPSRTPAPTAGRGGGESTSRVRCSRVASARSGGPYIDRVFLDPAATAHMIDSKSQSQPVRYWRDGVISPSSHQGIVLRDSRPTGKDDSVLRSTTPSASAGGYIWSLPVVPKLRASLSALGALEEKRVRLD